MDQVHNRAIEALQPFIHLANANSATSPRFIANLITNATSNPHTYVFAELLETPTIQALRSQDTPEEFQGYLTLLEIFAWGTWQDYQTTPNLPPLSPEQTLKLRLLSLLNLSATLKPLTYTTLMDALSISAPAELESLVTTAIYASLITARLSPASDPPTVNVTAVAPLRDIKPQSLPTMISLLTQWETRCGDVVGDIEAEIAKIKTNAAKRKAKEQARAELLEKALASLHDGKDVGVGVGGGGSAAGLRRFGGAQRFALGGGNKREYSADELDDADDGYWDNANDGGVDLHAAGSRMDIDESLGSSRLGLGGAGARHAKRFLGKKT
ncbi:putative COP9 signalosome subunit 7 (CsnG) [Aspergillus clavatus NRRL 1]|uniref:COP9 signalosome subunit 7 (CsnG), putative n=1 Tax=Aspergillus clavatus (strain ATCC 1007 / CBS 513.65 / DSM 816 / NCTC 3887 / NRRL 1 / QM 1276 / 107) TaxID=344612 RepID=A1CII5_ASPCL|nr:COP9 signalosome subunit 7 (CsnG), putative [Aspergillus clavatus NRRL 1]EAW10690.1 COP9 signalosome subunit 7 (CsnG), putative [Aspergillus clavatus NRRL 1]